MKTNLKRKLVIAFFIVAVVVGGWTTWYVFFKPHRNIANEKAAFTLTTTQLSQEFKNNNVTATTKYIDKAVLLEGTVDQIDASTITFGNVACNVDSTQLTKIANIKIGNKIKLQGQVVGYNDLLEEIGVAQCVLK